MKDLNEQKAKEYAIALAEAASSAKGDAVKAALSQQFKLKYEYLSRKKIKEKVLEVLEEITTYAQKDAAQFIEMLGEETLKLENSTAQPIGEMTVNLPSFKSFEETYEAQRESQSVMIGLNDPRLLEAASESVKRSVPIDLDEIPEEEVTRS